jgi:hypothetical protein
MIDYEMLCQTIEDWRAGRRPSIDLSATPVGAAEEYAEVEGDPGYDDGQGQYAEPNQEQAYDETYEEVPAAGYDDYEYDDGAPAPVATGGTAPVDVSVEELDEEEYDR